MFRVRDKSQTFTCKLSAIWRMYIILRSSNIHSFSSMFANLSTGILFKKQLSTKWLLLGVNDLAQIATPQVPGRESSLWQCPVPFRLAQPVRKLVRKSSVPHPKQDWSLPENRQIWCGWQHRLHCSNPVYKNSPLPVHGAYSSSLLFSGQQRFSQTPTVNTQR